MLKSKRLKQVEEQTIVLSHPEFLLTLVSHIYTRIALLCIIVYVTNLPFMNPETGNANYLVKVFNLAFYHHYTFDGLSKEMTISKYGY